MALQRRVALTSFLLLSTLFVSCTGMRESEAEKRKQQHAKLERISRKSTEVVYVIPPLESRTREKYPWEIGEGDS
jgi:hypothetical protein